MVNGTPAPTQTIRPRFEGPIQPGTSEEIFRETGGGVQTFTPVSGRGRISGGGGVSRISDFESARERERETKADAERAEI